METAMVWDWVPQRIRNVRKRVIAVVAATAISFFLLLATYVIAELTAFRLLDWTLILSLVVAELPIGVFLSLILGERRSGAYRTVERFNAMTRFSHLRVHRAQDWVDADYPDLQYFVLNERTGRAYQLQDSLHSLALEGIIRSSRKYQDKRELEKFFAVNGIQVFDRTASLEELGLGQGLLLED